MASSVLLVALALLAAASAVPERLAGGTPTDIAEFPYVVSLVYTYRPGVTVQRCVGSLISSWHVLTTASCFTGSTLSFFLIRAGSTNSLSGGTTVPLRANTLHPDYVESPRAVDLAVAVLDTPLGITANINVMYLPAQDNDNISDGFTGRVVSWGFENLNNQLDYLTSIYLTKISAAVCTNAYAGHDNAPAISEREVICASAPDQRICNGDSGAPMASGQVVVGIASHYECENAALPGVFTRVARYTNWIVGVAVPPTRTGVPVRIAPAH